MTTPQILSLGLALTCVSATAFAFELGTCALLKVADAMPSEADKLRITITADVFSKQQQASADSTETQSSLDQFSFSKEETQSEFSSESFQLPTEVNTKAEDSSLYDLGTTRDSFGDY